MTVEEYIAEWLQYAEADLDAGRKILAVGAYASVAFHCHQAAEKALKAAYMARFRADPPRVHDLIRLLRSLDAPRQLLDMAAEMSGDYARTRYPSPTRAYSIDYYTAEVAQGRLHSAEQIVAWCRAVIREPGNPTKPPPHHRPDSPDNCDPYQAAARLQADPLLAAFVDKAYPELLREFRLDHVIIFGSRARGEAHEWSDVDVILVSSEFEACALREYYARVWRALGDLTCVEVLCYTPEQFASLREVGLGLVAAACREGIWLEKVVRP